MLNDILVIVLGFAGAVCFIWFQNRNNKRTPPGPWGLPVFGHLLFLGKYPHQTLLKWSETYGPVLSVQFGSFPTIVINNGQIIRKAFNSAVLAGRPFINIIVDGNMRKGIVFADAEAARQQRQFMRKNLKDFGPQGQSMETRVCTEMETLLSFILSHEGQPLNISYLFYSSVTNSLMDILLSKRFEPGDPDAFELAKTIHKLTLIDGILENLGIFITKLVHWFPDACGHTRRIQCGHKVQAYLRKLVEEHTATFIKGQPRDLTDAYLEVSEATTEADSSFHPNVDNLVINLYDTIVAGTDTVSLSLEWTIYYFLKNPAALIKLQAEIDRVIGQERRPRSADRSLMAYTEAVINEVLRKSSVVPVGLFHRAVEDETIEGYFVPTDTSIVANIYAAHHDPQVWGDPENFRPERWIGQDGKVKRIDDLVAFSAGKRSCRGETVARMELFLFITSIFQSYDRKPVGDLPPPDGFGKTLAPLPFKCTFTRRSLVSM